jgi:hypothetical protein
MFTEVNATVTNGMEAMPPADLLKRHGLVSEKDFANEPLRNRLALFEIRAAHATYHAGQIRLVEIACERKTEGKAS